MLSLSHLRLVQYRNYTDAVHDIAAPVTCITGPNGSGKTNLLDAAYLLCYSKSYFTSFHQQAAQHGADGFRVEGLMTHDGHPETIVCKWKDGLKEISRDGVAYDRVQDYIGRHTAVMIAPDDLELINGGSELRRRWVDAVLGQTSPGYLDRLLTYTRILSQRRAWLRQQAVFANADGLVLEFYDAQLAEHGTEIFRQRAAFVAVFQPILSRYYRAISAGNEQAEIGYQSQLQQHDLAGLLRAHLQSDVRTQRTNYGIHRDDLPFVLDGIPARNFASQGQKKSLLFAIKLAQYEYLCAVLGHTPILLLDDVFEKLDQHRMEALLTIIKGPGFGQVMLTDTHPARVREAFGAATEVGMIALG